MKKIFYEKVGRRYKPVYEYDQTLLDSFPQGNHLICVYPGGKSTRYKVDPNYAAMIAAGRVAEDAVCNAIIEAQKCRPHRQPITEEQRTLWKALAKSLHQDDFPLMYPAARDAGEAAVKAMMNEAEKLMTNPAVKKAFEHFLLVCELTKEDMSE